MGRPRKTPETTPEKPATKARKTPKIRDLEVLQKLDVEKLTNAEKNVLIKNLRVSLVEEMVKTNQAEQMIAKAKDEAEQAIRERDMLISKVDEDIAYLKLTTNAYVSSMKRIIGGK